MRSIGPLNDSHNMPYPHPCWLAPLKNARSATCVFSALRVR